MFQNITKDPMEKQDIYNEEGKKVNTKDVLKRLFAKQNLILYVILYLFYY